MLGHRAIISIVGKRHIILLNFRTVFIRLELAHLRVSNTNVCRAIALTRFVGYLFNRCFLFVLDEYHFILVTYWTYNTEIWRFYRRRSLKPYRKKGNLHQTHTAMCCLCRRLKHILRYKMHFSPVVHYGLFKFPLHYYVYCF